MPLCGGSKTVHRKLVLLYPLTTPSDCQRANRYLKTEVTVLAARLHCSMFLPQGRSYLPQPSEAYLMRHARL